MSFTFDPKTQKWTVTTVKADMPLPKSATPADAVAGLQARDPMFAVKDFLLQQGFEQTSLKWATDSDDLQVTICYRDKLPDNSSNHRFDFSISGMLLATGDWKSYIQKVLLPL